MTTASATERLAHLERDAVRTTARVGEAVAHATAALLDGDRALAEMVAARHCVIELECQALEEMALAGSADVGVAVAAGRIASELAAAGALARHLAAAVPRIPAHSLPPRVRGLLSRIGDEARLLLVSYHPEAEVLHDLHRRLLAELFAGVVPLPVAVELTLVGRYYEAIGDHALAIAHLMLSGTDSAPTPSD